ncbi:MAG: tetratricopeptide repeat protein [Chloroflexi bacterium]|nr:tetratricopeptide repeat protein [Chloroflexota bacterium]
MYLRTPKRYRPKKRRIHLISHRTAVLMVLIPLLAFAGWMIWQNRDQVRRAVGENVVPAVEDLMVSARTQVAPKPTPTVTPDLFAAQTACRSAQQQGNLREAVEQCLVLANGSPNDVQVHYEVAHLLVITSDRGANRSQLQRAVIEAEKTINANPELPHGWAIKAMALSWLGDTQGALAAGLQARALDDSFAPAYAFLGKVYQDLGQYDLAENYLDQALELDNAGLAAADALRNKGKLLSDQGFYQDALTPYRLALQQAPTQTYIAVELAQNLVALNEIDEAIGVLTAALERNPTDASALWYLGTVHFRNGDPPRAMEYYSRCLDHNPEAVLCLSYLGGLQWLDGDYATAANNLQRAIDLGSQDPDDFYQLGNSLASLGRCPDAIPYLRDGLSIAQANEDEARQQRFRDALNSCGAAG